ncbi:phage tail sheath subtilisin-like domain-containing protein [Pseudomonas kielensis]|uniref:phage tail sheath family protein n=1 Tax=Pseudomonas kielensis TaxID=2762577 RepID=UPI0022405EF6|nr:phage tail sheath C-terminal domain-containing protein [Pseudomonas kielensis]UZM16223.1 phage tail sheath subtilisin-like domain-containing protein [Pseudomonas kielensis]
MPIVPTYPGVYIEELLSQSLSIVSGATAVPAIATNSPAPFDTTVKITSWLEFMTLVPKFDTANTLHVSVKTYFDNGGGYCYLIPTDQLEAKVPKLDDVTLLVAAGQDIEAVAGKLCVKGACLFAILDGENNAVPTAPDSSVGAFAAVYYPWLKADWADDIPPSAAVAGAYCTVDRERGVWKAPANIELKGGVKPKYKVSDATQGHFNRGKALNMIREFQDSGTLIWGSRTLEPDLDWRYVPVRRLFNSAEKDIKKTMQTMVFEPNNSFTWERVRGAIDNYLRKLWQEGGLLGNSEKEAYFVQIGKGLSMTEDDIKDGRMIVNVGMAAVRPAEFIILQFTQDVGQG